ncbi:hypothetical protein BDE36_1158 [Arcticibacter tournemirensis]|nr:hypothetical protein BDE36_1158 [Arcticibacter tournemirensis]
MKNTTKIIIVALSVLCILSIRLNVSTLATIKRLKADQQNKADSIRILKRQIANLKFSLGGQE